MSKIIEALAKAIRKSIQGDAYVAKYPWDRVVDPDLAVYTDCAKAAYTAAVAALGNVETLEVAVSAHGASLRKARESDEVRRAAFGAQFRAALLQLAEVDDA